MEPSRQVVDHGSELTRAGLEAARAEPTNGSGVRPQPGFSAEMLPPHCLRPATSLATKFAHASVNKSKQPVFSLTWTPEGRRLLAGAMNGEFTLWHGMNFGFEMVMQAHDNAVRCTAYSHSGEWLISGDQDGELKVWQPNFNNVKMHRAHDEVVRGVAWSPTDAKFATASDDGSVKIWSFAQMSEETVFKGKQGHGWDVKCVDWHPQLGLVVSGSKDNTVRFWDPRQGRPLLTVHEFKNTVTRTRFQPGGSQMLLAAASRDHTAHIFDLRQLGTSEHPEASMVLRGHPADVSCLDWHPTHAQLLTTGTHDGSIHHFLLDRPSKDPKHILPVWTIPKAHPWPVWDVAYHPVGHMLASGSNDKSVRFWTRAKPGDTETEALDARFYSADGEFGGGESALASLRVPTVERPKVIPGLQ